MPLTPLAAATAAVADWCEWHVAPEKTETITVEGGGTDTLLLPTLHLVSVAAVTDLDNDGAPVTGWRQRTRGVLFGCWAKRRLYEVTMTHGYAAMPDSVQAVIDAVAAREPGSTGQLAQVGQVRYAVDPATGAPYGGLLTAAERSALARYKLNARP